MDCRHNASMPHALIPAGIPVAGLAQLLCLQVPSKQELAAILILCTGVGLATVSGGACLLPLCSKPLPHVSSAAVHWLHAPLGVALTATA